jgi:hypothetical protein
MTKIFLELPIFSHKTIIGRAMTVEYETTIGEYSRIMTHSQLTGTMIIDDYVFFGGAVASTNDKYMGRTDNQFNGPELSWEPELEQMLQYWQTSLLAKKQLSEQVLL